MDDPLIRVITGQTPRWFIFSSFFASHYDRLEKIHKEVEICDPDLEKKLTEEQFEKLCDKFPYLKPASSLPKEPEPLKTPTQPIAPSAPSDPTAPVAKEVAREETNLDFASMEVPQLKEFLKDNGIKFDGRKRKPQYFIELAQTA